MPLLSQPVSELTQHIFNPVIHQTVNRLIDLLGYTDVIGDQVYVNTDWSTHTRTSSLDNSVFLGQQTFRCDAHLQMNPSSQKYDCYSFQHTTAYGITNNTMNDSMPIYWDPENRVRNHRYLQQYILFLAPTVGNKKRQMVRRSRLLN